MPDLFAYLLIALAATGCGIVLRRTLVYSTTAHSISMAPTLTEGDVLLTRRIHAGTRLARGDIIVLYLDELQRSVVKRLVGLPGDEVAVESDGIARVTADPPEQQLSSRERDGQGSHRVPAGHYYFLGDNRPCSSDSRSWTQPYVARARLEGKVCFRVWPRPQSFIRGQRMEKKPVAA